MKKLALFCAACLLALTGCTRLQGAESSPPVQTPHVPTPTPLAVESALPTPEPTPVPTPALPTSAPADETVAPTETTPVETVAPTETVPLPTETVQPEGWDGDPDKLKLEDFPTQLVETPQLHASLADPDSAQPLYLIAQLPESDTWLYGMGGTDTGVILRVGQQWKYFDLRYLTVRAALPQMYYGDFDGDMDLELAILAYTDSGTGVSIWTLSIVEFGDTGWTALTFQDTEYQAILEQSVLCSFDAQTNVATLHLGDVDLPVELPQDPGGAVDSYVGEIVSFQVDGDAITGKFAVGLHAPNIGYSLFYPADIYATVLYTGTSFGLGDLTLAPYTD